MGRNKNTQSELSLKMGVLRMMILVTFVLESLASPYDVRDFSSKKEAVKTRKSRNMGRITGGEAVEDIEQYGFMASVLATRINEEVLFCAGFILTEDTIGTAAYCVFGVEPLTMDVRVASTRISTGTRVPISEIIINPPYDPEKPEQGANLALLKAEDFLPISSDAYPISFPPYMFELPEEGSMITVFGWGQTVPGNESSTSDQLMKIEMPIISPDQCAISYFFSVADDEFCAGTILGGGGACEGDMGGPAIYDDILVGVVSGGRGCGAPVSPSIFTDITHEDSIRFITYFTDIIQ